MKCAKCKNDTSCRKTTVYYVRILGQTTTNTGKTTAVQRTTYKAILDREVYICESCLYKDKIIMLLIPPLALMMLPIFYMFGIIGGNLSIEELSIIAMIIFWGPFLVSVGIAGYLLISKRYKNIKETDVYRVARDTLKKEHKQVDPSGRYSYWPKKPENLHHMEY